MDRQSRGGTNIVALFFGAATICVLAIILLAVSSKQWQDASNPSLYPQATINYADPNAPDTVETQIVHSKANVLLMFLVPGAIIIVVVIVVVSIIANRRIRRQTNNLNTYYNDHS